MRSGPINCKCVCGWWVGVNSIQRVGRLERDGAKRARNLGRQVLGWYGKKVVKTRIIPICKNIIGSSRLELHENMRETKFSFPCFC